MSMFDAPPGCVTGGPPLMPAYDFDSLEPRLLLAWGTYPTLTHQDLADHLWKNPGEIAGDGIDNDHDGYVDDVTGYDFVRNDGTPDDENGHGTATNGIIAASPFTYNGATYQGLAQGAKVINLKVLDQNGPEDVDFQGRVEKALQWVEAANRRFKITAINMSFWTA